MEQADLLLWLAGVIGGFIVGWDVRSECEKRSLPPNPLERE